MESSAVIILESDAEIFSPSSLPDASTKTIKLPSLLAFTCHFSEIVSPEARLPSRFFLFLTLSSRGEFKVTVVLVTIAVPKLVISALISNHSPTLTLLGAVILTFSGFGRTVAVRLALWAKEGTAVNRNTANKITGRDKYFSFGLLIYSYFFSNQCLDQRTDDPQLPIQLPR